MDCCDLNATLAGPYLHDTTCRAGYDVLGRSAELEAKLMEAQNLT